MKSMKLELAMIGSELAQIKEGVKQLAQAVLLLAANPSADIRRAVAQVIRLTAEEKLRRSRREEARLAGKKEREKLPA